jgi:hypothetical protein
MTKPISGLIDLQFAEVGTFSDDPSVWPSRIRLDGFSYRELQPYRSAKQKTGRLAWLARDNAGYNSQPYEQLAAYYRRLGNEVDARRVLLAKEQMRHRSIGIVGRIIGWFLDILVGYGYRPGRAFFWFLALWSLSVIYFAHNPPMPVNPASHPSFNPFVYAASVVTPVMTFGQSNTWYNNGIAQVVAAIMVGLGFCHRLRSRHYASPHAEIGTGWTGLHRHRSPSRQVGRLWPPTARVGAGVSEQQHSCAVPARCGGPIR